MLGAAQVVTEPAAPGGSLVTLPVTCGTQTTGRKSSWGWFPAQGSASEGVEWAKGDLGAGGQGPLSAGMGRVMAVGGLTASEKVRGEADR